MKKSLHPPLYFLLCGLLFFVGCRSTKINSSRGSDYIAPYDHLTLSADQAPYLMPYNRLLEPAGQSVRFGDGAYENHSLDVVILPDDKTVCVEDRYGIAFFETPTQKMVYRWSYADDAKYRGSMSTYSGIASIVYHDSLFIFWSAGGRQLTGKDGSNANSYVFQAYWDGKKIEIINLFPFKAEAPATIALPNQVLARIEGEDLYFYTVLNGNNKAVKTRVRDHKQIWQSNTGVAPYGIEIIQDKVYVTNWAGPVPDAADGLETAGIPWGQAYIDPKTGAMSQGSVTLLDASTGMVKKQIPVGLHPNAILSDPDKNYIYVVNGNSDNISVIDVITDEVMDTIAVGLFDTYRAYIGSTPNALAMTEDGKTLFVTNGMDNAVCVIDRHKDALQLSYEIKGYIPTEAYPSGIVVHQNTLIVTNLESTGARAFDLVKAHHRDTVKTVKVYNAHHQLASISFIPVPSEDQLKTHTANVKKLSLEYRLALTDLLPRPDIAPTPVPERIGEPSVFKHVLYIIKENRTYDQVLGDLKEGRGMPSLCIFGDTVTPNQHKLARDYVLMDNYHVSGKGSAEGHHWANAAMVTDYTEKSVRAWFRSYPHVLNDAMVYNKNGLLWNNALDHGKSVKIYGEACDFNYDKTKYNWSTLYNMWSAGTLSSFDFKNTTTISRIRPVLSATFPGGADLSVTDQMRADAFIKELGEIESMPGDQLPNLMIMALPNDHTAGTNPNFPTPRAMVADNDLAVGRIVEALTHSRFADNTVIFISEDDSQAGWDHISAYRTTGFVVSAYSRLKKTVGTNYNQTSMVRTIEQILGLPPMNVLDATALPMFHCFNDVPNTSYQYKAVKNNIPLNEMNPQRQNLQGAALKWSDRSVQYAFHIIDQGKDDLLNRILWYSVKGSQPYPAKYAGEADDDD
ncbi:MAG: hypothetical protein KA109_13740 [Saprospiraceae bacterium]|nr:phosphoesterase [Saprospiraceae bacterium]MBP7802682.1 hypothetical protein [Saprospiraceae bacterium]MBP7923828.1 hypothetical protein [Saprospiraceae bacterium]